MAENEKGESMLDAVAPELREIVNGLSGGGAAHEAAARAVEFLSGNWSQAITHEEIEKDFRTDNLFAEYDEMIAILKGLRPTVRKALEAADAADVPAP